MTSSHVWLIPSVLWVCSGDSSEIQCLLFLESFRMRMSPVFITKGVTLSMSLLHCTRPSWEEVYFSFHIPWTQPSIAALIVAQQNLPVKPDTAPQRR